MLYLNTISCQTADYSYNGNKFATYDSRASYNDPPKSAYPTYNDPPKSPFPVYDPPKSPPMPPYGGYDQGSNYDNNTYDSRYYKDRKLLD